MLRITLRVREGAMPLMRVEGRIAGEWVGELARTVASATAGGPGLVIDLSEVTFVDRDGADLLRALHRGGIQLTACSRFIGALLGCEGGRP